MNIFRCMIFFAALLAAAICPAADEPPAPRTLADLIYMTEEYYPFSYTENGVVRGLSSDLLRKVWEELGIEEQPIHSLPWARAYERIQRDRNTVLYGMARAAEREKLFLWAGPILTVRFVLLAKKSRGLVINNLDDITGYRIGTLRDDISDILLNDYRTKAKIEQVAQMEINLDKLVSDRLDMVAYEERSWQRMVESQGMSPDDFETLYSLKETPLYYVFHLETPDSLVQQFQGALDRVKQTPAYQGIIDTYLK